MSDQAAKVAVNSFSIAVKYDSPGQVHEFFDALKVDGKVIMEPGDSSWGSVFGQCTDKFDVTWMLEASK